MRFTMNDGLLRTRRTHLLLFFALTFAWSWLFWWGSSVLKSGPALLLSTLASFGPSVAALIVVGYTQGRAGLRDWLRRCWQWRVGIRWLAFGLFLPLVVMALAAALHKALGGTLAPSPAREHLPLVVLNFMLVFFLGGPLGEELGWRGYALPRLQERYGWRIASVGLGIVWGLWHLPLFFIPNTVQSQIPFALFLLSTIAMSILFAWLFNRTQESVVPALVLHTALNAWPSLVVPLLPNRDDFRAYGLAVGLLTLVALGLLRTRRAGNP